MSPSDTLRTELIFLPEDASVAGVGEGTTTALRLLVPSNPTWWWGNCLHMGAAPAAGDFDRWMALFDETIRALQPKSVHHAFAWDGDAIGVVAPFVDAGFAHFEIESLGVSRREDAIVPDAVDRPAVAVTGARWDELTELLIATREPIHGEAGYREYVGPRVALWRRLCERGQGRWFCVLDDDDAVASALGVFAEAVPGADGRRIGRFQHVTTRPDARRRGYAGMLVAHATRFAFERLGVDEVRISADANDAPRRVYEACGYRPRSRHQGLERPD